MGRTLQAVVERCATRWVATWSFVSCVEFTGRHNGFYNDLNELSTFLRCGEPIDRLTLVCLSNAMCLDFDLADWNRKPRTFGVRVVSASDYLGVLAKWEATNVTTREFDSDGLRMIGATLDLAHNELAAWRVVFWYDDAPFVDIEQTLRDRDAHRVH